MPAFDSPPFESTKRKHDETMSDITEDAEYFTLAPHTQRTVSHRPTLKVHFEHLLALDHPPKDDLHPNEMYSHDRVTTPHPAQRILHRSCSTPPSRSSSGSDLTPGIAPFTALSSCLSSPPVGGDDEEIIYPDSPTIKNTLRGNSWVFDEAERMSVERTRGRVVEIGGLGGSSRLRNGSERSLRSLLASAAAAAAAEGSPGGDRERAKRMDSNAVQEASPPIPVRHPDREKKMRDVLSRTRSEGW